MKSQVLVTVFVILQFSSCNLLQVFIINSLTEAFLLFIIISYFTWVFIQMLSSVTGPECTEQFDSRDGFSLLIMFRASHKQWKVAILISIVLRID